MSLSFHKREFLCHMYVFFVFFSRKLYIDYLTYIVFESGIIGEINAYLCIPVNYQELFNVGFIVFSKVW